MTFPDDQHPERADQSAEDAAAEQRPAPDDDAVWAQIVANYGERPEMGPEATAPTPPAAPTRAGVFDRSYLDSVDGLETGATWEDEGHFVPPEPPPLPHLDPRRAIAWGGLIGGPFLLLVAVVFGLAYPTWLTGILVAGFVGGFVFLVATMPRGRHDDWSGDDGAVV